MLANIGALEEGIEEAAGIECPRLRTLHKIMVVWETYPQWSLGKIYWNALDIIDKARDKKYIPVDVFGVSDEVLEEGLDTLITAIEFEMHDKIEALERS